MGAEEPEILVSGQIAMKVLVLMKKKKKKESEDRLVIVLTC